MFTYLSEVSRADAVPIGGGNTIPGYNLNTRDNFQWKISMTQPLFTGFALTSAHELAKLGIDQSKLNLETTKLDLVLRVKEAYFDILGAEKAVEQGEENLRVSEERYKAQVTTITEVLDAQTLLTQARVNYYSALYSHNLAKARLRRGMGEY
jgi:outer membrane protein